MLPASSLYVMCFFPFHFHNDAIRRLEYQVANVPLTKLVTPGQRELQLVTTYPQ